MSKFGRIEILEKTLKLTKDYNAPPLCMVFTDTVAPKFSGQNSLQTLVTQEKVQDTVLRYRDKRVTLLNFASAKTPGGAARRGGIAQEEDICRCSGLLHSLDRVPRVWYDTWRMPFGYDDRLLLSYNVPFIRNGDHCFVDTMYADVITCAAPNIADGLPPEKMKLIIEHRTRWIVYTAAMNRAEVLILGAFGCGVFGNDPHVVAQAWKQAVQDHAGGIQQIVHPIYGSIENYNAFV